MGKDWRSIERTPVAEIIAELSRPSLEVGFVEKRKCVNLNYCNKLGLFKWKQLVPADDLQSCRLLSRSSQWVASSDGLMEYATVSLTFSTIDFAIERAKS